MEHDPEDDLMTDSVEDCLDPLAPLTSVEEAALRRACEPRRAGRPPLTEEDVAQVIHWARVQKTWNIYLDLICRGHGSVFEMKDNDWPTLGLTPEGQRLLKQSCREFLLTQETEQNRTDVG